MLAPLQILQKQALHVSTAKTKKIFLYPEKMWDAVEYLDDEFIIRKTAINTKSGIVIRDVIVDEKNPILFDYVILGISENYDIYYIFDFEFRIGIIFIDNFERYNSNFLERLSSERIYRLSLEENISTCQDEGCRIYLQCWLELPSILNDGNSSA